MLAKIISFLQWKETERNTNVSSYCGLHPAACTCGDASCTIFSDEGYQFHINY